MLESRDYLLTKEEMKAYEEQRMSQYKISPLTLMERAAMAVAMQVPDEGKRIAAVVYTGKNGADGLAVARILRENGRTVDVYEVTGNHVFEEFTYQKKILLSYPNGRYTVWDSSCEFCLAGYDVIIDGLFGIGLNRPVSGEAAFVIERMNTSEAEIIAIDIPSGVDGNTGEMLGNAVRASKTVTFGYRKPGLCLYPGKDYAGQVTTASIGLPRLSEEEGIGRIEAICRSDYSPVPERSGDSNKGTYGKIAILAGSATMPGAATMVTKACYRSGAGVVTLFSEESVLATVRTTVCEAITRSDLTPENAETMLTRYEPIVIGPGLSGSEYAVQLVKAVSRIKKTTVYDADAITTLGKLLPELETNLPFLEAVQNRLNALSEMIGERAILTPHKLELARLLGTGLMEVKEHFQELLPVFKKLPFVIVLKDATTYVAGQGRLYLNETGNNGMATGGSGDVLCGIIGAFAAVCEPFEAAKRGVYLHGLAGDDARDRLSETAMSAGDILDSLVNIVRPDRYRSVYK